jgi:hypothetical protein
MTKVLQIVRSCDLHGTATLERLNFQVWHEQCYKPAMPDFAALLATVAFFALAISYVLGCQKI